MTIAPPRISQEYDLAVDSLGECLHPSPLPAGTPFVDDTMRVLLSSDPRDPTRVSIERAGPRERIFFDGRAMRAGVVTCGGLCPGVNNVVRALVMELHHKYHVRNILGFRYGFEGLDPASALDPVTLAPDAVRLIHQQGGSILGLSRGAHPVSGMVDRLVALGVDALFVVGGDGSLRGASAIHEEVRRRGKQIAVVGVPKTIDNDVPFVDKTFGFDTAVELARLAIDSAHTEAMCARNGVGLVRLMGRDAGFIASAATLASANVNFCLIPEFPVALEGENGLLRAIERRIVSRGHCVVVVAEGCAKYLTKAIARDASGNASYSKGDADVGAFLQGEVRRYLKSRGIESTTKYIDPSYMIRSVPANAGDAILCGALGRNAVHAAMAGKAGIVVGRWNRVFTHVPLALVATHPRRVDDYLWHQVLETTGQPELTASAPTG